MASTDQPSQPAGEPVPVQPVAYRSNRLRFFVMVAALGLVGLSFVFWVALPANLKAEFTLSQAVTLLLILGAFVFALLIVGNGVVKADADGLYFRNGLSRHRYAWSRVHRVVMRPGDAWAVVLLIPTDRPVEVAADLDHRMLMGIQKGDGAYATEAVEDLNRRLKASRQRGA
ncbi:MAG TPA: PH domain-containing protein [Microlunatus sp.]